MGLSCRGAEARPAVQADAPALPEVTTPSLSNREARYLESQSPHPVRVLAPQVYRLKLVRQMSRKLQMEWQARL
jgi:hypothetical protein